MTGHQIAEAFATLAKVIDERDALHVQLAAAVHERKVAERKAYRQGYETGYAARKRTEGQAGNKPHSLRAAA